MAVATADSVASPSHEAIEVPVDDSAVSDAMATASQADAKSPSNSHGGSNEEAEAGAEAEADVPVKKDAKDPSRPRRKKARRACFACQRAHLTCGDERPCLRCIKRGLQDQCHDGVRKKAKYLHDAPNEALVPPLPGSYHSHNPGASDSPMNAPNGAIFNRTPSSDLTNFRSGVGPTQSPQNHEPSFVDALSTAGRSSFSTDGQQLTNTISDQERSSMPPPAQQFDVLFDPTNPGFFNFDTSNLNFDNRYGAHEYMMLGNMTNAGSYDSPDNSSLMNQVGQSTNLNFDSTNYSSANNDFQYGNNANYQNWQPPLSRHGGSAQGFVIDDFPGAFAIRECSGSIASMSPGNTGLDFSTYGGNNNNNDTGLTNTSQAVFHHRPHPEFPQANASNNPIANPNTAASRRPRRDPSIIYQSVKQPYSYTTGFHLLTAFLAKRFSKEKTLKIAQSLASIRPSFITNTKDLSRDDLIFMEKGFQRNLLLYDDYISAYGSPTLICRRTGEIAAVSKEFSMLTGWRRDVLLGKEANLNINHGTSGSATGSSSRGASTPSRHIETEPGRQQPVFVAELLDDDTAVQFYDDFSKMAFGDSRGQVTRRGKLLKYKTKDDPGWSQGMASELRINELRNNGQNKGQFGGGIDILGEKDGKVDVMFCHIVKRDTFDIPMMIIMNFLPVIP